MNIKEVINVLNTSKIEGLQLAKKNGMLSSTWVLYKRGKSYFYFDINQKIEFVDCYKYSEIELVREFQKSNYSIDLVIN